MPSPARYYAEGRVYFDEMENIYSRYYGNFTLSIERVAKERMPDGFRARRVKGAVVFRRPVRERGEWWIVPGGRQCIALNRCEDAYGYEEEGMADDRRIIVDRDPWWPIIRWWRKVTGRME